MIQTSVQYKWQYVELADSLIQVAIPYVNVFRIISMVQHYLTNVCHPKKYFISVMKTLSEGHIAWIVTNVSNTVWGYYGID